MAQDPLQLRVEMVGCADLLIALESLKALHAGRDRGHAPAGA
jgi:hypothetical protein